MKINYSHTGTKYFDIWGDEIHANDTILMDGRAQKVYKTDDGELGTDATNPHWIEIGRAVPTEYGVYAFNKDDQPILLKPEPILTKNNITPLREKQLFEERVVLYKKGDKYNIEAHHRKDNNWNIKKRTYSQDRCQSETIFLQYYKEMLQQYE